MSLWLAGSCGLLCHMLLFNGLSGSTRVCVCPQNKVVVPPQSRTLILRGEFAASYNNPPSCKILPVQHWLRHQQHDAKHGVVQQQHVVWAVLLLLANAPIIPRIISMCFAIYFFLILSHVVSMAESSYVPTVVKDISATKIESNFPRINESRNRKR
jgi:hypothetical protein